MTVPRIAFVTSGLNVGGAEHMLCRVVEAAKARDWEIMVISLRDEGGFGERIESAGVPLLCCNLHRARGAFDLCRALIKLRSFEPALVQGWMYHGSLFASLFCKALKNRPEVFWSIRQTLLSVSGETFIIAMIIRLLARYSDHVSGVIYNSGAALKQHAQVGLVSFSDVVIPNGIDIERFRPDLYTRKKTRAALGIGEDEPVIGIVARFHPMKDHANFFESARILATSIPSLRVLVVGDGTRAGIVDEAIAKAGLCGRTVCLGSVKSIEEIYPALDLLVLSSAWGEAWPNVLGEAMACGVTCVATDVGESRQIVGQTGVIVPVCEPELLAGACRQMLSLDPAIQRELSRNARERIERYFSIEFIFSEYAARWACIDVRQS